MDCLVCEQIRDECNLPVYCEVHKDNGNKNLSELVAQLVVIEALRNEKEIRERLLDQQVARVHSWKAGVYRA